MGLNEAGGHVAVAVAALATGWVALGLGLSAILVEETQHHSRPEARTHEGSQVGNLTGREIFTPSSFREIYLSAASQAGMVNNLSDGLAWGVYRLRRDSGYAVGALLAGMTADLLGSRPAIWIVAIITAISGLSVAVRMYETQHLDT